MRIKNVISILLVSTFINYSCNCINDDCDNTSTKSNTNTNKEKSITKSNKKMEHLTSKTFKEKVFNYETNKAWKFAGQKPCIIDFYADWCGPCKMVAPVLEDLAKEYDGKIDIYKVNTEEQQELASAFGIRSIPSILFCPMDGDPRMAQGALPKKAFVDAINDVLLKQNVTNQN